MTTDIFAFTLSYSNGVCSVRDPRGVTVASYDTVGGTFRPLEITYPTDTTHTEITLNFRDTAGTTLLALHLKPGGALVAKSGDGEQVWATFNMPNRGNAINEIVWDLGPQTPNCKVKINIKRD